MDHLSLPGARIPAASRALLIFKNGTPAARSATTTSRRPVGVSGGASLLAGSRFWRSRSEGRFVGMARLWQISAVTRNCGPMSDERPAIAWFTFYIQQWGGFLARAALEGAPTTITMF
jgi:hypothetical protein